MRVVCNAVFWLILLHSKDTRDKVAKLSEIAPKSWCFWAAKSLGGHQCPGGVHSALVIVRHSLACIKFVRGSASNNNWLWVAQKYGPIFRLFWSKEHTPDPLRSLLRYPGPLARLGKRRVTESRGRKRIRFHPNFLFWLHPTCEMPDESLLITIREGGNTAR